MKDEMFDYDFDMFKKKNDSVIDESRLASKPAKIDIFTEFEELDTFDITDEDLDFEENLINGYQDLISEARARKDSSEEDSLLSEITNDDEMNTTMEIDSFHDEILEKMEEIQQKEPEEMVEISENVSEENLEKEPMSLEAAFIYCSVLGFIIMIFGYEWFFYIINNI